MPFLQVDDETLGRLKELHRKRSLGVATGWEELDRVLAGLLGPLERRKRCETCNATGWSSAAGSCPTCNGHGYVILGTERKMDCPACGEAE